MFDNTTINPASTSGGDTIRTVAKTANGAKTQVTIIDVGGGADGSPETPLVLGQAAKASSLPVTLASDQGAVTVSFSGSTGTDYSVNQPTLPNIGANFGATGPYANYTLVKTIPASATRRNLDIENTSGAQIVVLLDDGTATSGNAPANATVFAISGGGTVGAQGGSWSSQTEQGRVQLFGPAGTSPQIAVRTN